MLVVFVMPLDELEGGKQERMQEIVADLKRRMQELDDLGKTIRMEGRLVSPASTRKILEEIKVPPLKLLK